MIAFIDLSGETFGKWTVISRSSKKRVTWVCVCECGNEREVDASSLRSGRSISCGCISRKLIADRSYKHGLSRSSEYYTWKTIIQRCTNPNNKSFKNYGGRGIVLCDRWKNFDSFIADMGNRPPWLSIDRIDVNGNYEPDNCRWATSKEQTDNRRPFKYKGLHGENNPTAKLSKIDIEHIRRIAGSSTQSRIAEMFDITPSNVSRIIAGKTWRSAT